MRLLKLIGLVAGVAIFGTLLMVESPNPNYDLAIDALRWVAGAGAIACLVFLFYDKAD